MQQRILVTGGASGLGKEIALRWAKAGADVCIADLNEVRAQEVIEELTSLGAKAMFCRCDITNEQDILAVKEAVMQTFGGVDLVVNNAGVASAGSLVEENIEQWQWVLEINVLGAVRVSQCFADVFRQQGHGYFLNVASQAGITAAPMMGSYCASKAAMVSFSETIRLELIDDNIGVSVLCPSFFKTNLDESVRSVNPAMRGVVTKLLERGKLSAADVADMAFAGVQRSDFMIVTHSEGRKAYRIKRWIPNFYLKLMAKQTAKMRSKAGK